MKKNPYLYSENFVSSLMLILVSIFYLFSITQFKGVMKSDGISSTRFPLILGLALLITGLIIMYGAVKNIKNKVSVIENEDEDGDIISSKMNDKRVLITFILLAFYLFGMPSLGFLISTFVYLVLQISVLSDKDNRNYIKIIILSFVFTLIIFLTFTRLLNMMLPRGLFTF